jgi:WD40 repeat protein/tRNA A-37 threonylcarbamoyl transferase component Bud32
MIKLLGQGGFGRTYLAEDIDKLNEKCVVKQFVPMMQGTAGLQKALELFEREARQLQQLGHHPQIPALSAYFSENNQLYLIQQYIEGETLDQILQKQGVWTEQQVKELLISLLPVLKFIHQQKVIHRDLKPDNIMRRGNGEYVLIDFGVAKDLSATVIHTQVGTRVGSDGYAAKEQILGGEAYPASDLYSLGVTCFYLLTLVSPLNLMLDDGYRWTNNWQNYIKQDLSPELNKVLDQLLKKDIEDRYSCADQVLHELQQTSTNTIPSTSQKLSSTPSLKISWPNAICISTLKGHSKDVNSVVFSPDSQMLASGSGDNTIKLWDLRTQKEIATLSEHTNAVSSVTFSLDGRMLASGSIDNSIKLRKVQNQQQNAIVTLDSYFVLCVAFSPDSYTLASGSWNNTVKLWDLQSLKQIATLTGHSNAVRSVAFSPDSQILASGSQDNSIKLWNVQNQQEIGTFTGHSNHVHSVAFSPDGQILASGSWDKTIKLWNVQNQQEISTLTGHSQIVYSVVFSPDGGILASGSGDRTIKLWDVQNQQEISTLTGHLSSIHSVAFSPNNQMLASASWDNTIKLWQAW